MSEVSDLLERASPLKMMLHWKSDVISDGFINHNMTIADSSGSGISVLILIAFIG